MDDRYCMVCNIYMKNIPDEYCENCIKIHATSILEIDKYNFTQEDITQFIRDHRADRFGLMAFQKEALNYVVKNAKSASKNAYSTVLKKIKSINGTEKELKTIIDYVREDAPCIIHVSLPRYLNHLFKDTHYRNQFETGFSSGCKSLSSRRAWEQRMFGTNYDDVANFDRVKYGVINLFSHPNGVHCATPYGKSYFLLKKHMRERCTFTSCDSSNHGALVGTCEYFLHILNTYTNEELRDIMLMINNTKRISDAPSSTYKEMQIHGEIRLDRDIECLFVSPQDIHEIDLEHVEEFRIKNGFNVVYLE